jgi:hypothetical protein
MAGHMAKSGANRSKSPPATTPERREQQLIALATDLAEEHLRNGTASSQLITELVKRGSRQAQLDLEKSQQENALLRAKIDQISTSGDGIALVENALAAFRGYSGQTTEDEYEG